MRIAMLIWNYWPGPEGGTERQCRNLAARLVARGHTCHVFTHWPGFGVPRIEADGRSRVIRLGSFAPFLKAARKFRDQRRPSAAGPAAPDANAPAPSRRRFRLLAPLQWLDQACFMAEAAILLWWTRRRIDVIHVHESHWLCGFAAWLGKGLDLPVVCKEASYPAFSSLGTDVPFARAWERFRRTPFFIAQGSHAARDLAEKGVPAPRIFEVPNGVDLPPEPSPVRSPPGVLYVGNLTQKVEWKGFDVLFDAWCEVHAARSDLRLTVVGAGDPAPWRERLRAGNAAASVHFAGPAADPAPHYREAGLLVLPSLQEGQSNALLEAQSWGLPAVVSDIPGSRAVVENEINGLVVPVRDAGALARAILRLAANADLRERLGRQGRLRIQQRHTWDRVLDRVEAAYRQARSANEQDPLPCAG